MGRGATPEVLGESNRMLILNHLRLTGNMSRADLCRDLGISFPAISSNVKSLLEQDYIREVGAGDNSLGRKSTLLAFNQERGYLLGVDLGRFWIRVTMSDLAGEELASVKRATNTDEGARGTIKEICELLMEVVRNSGRTKEKVLRICIGTPGVVGDDRFLLAPFLPNLSVSELKNAILEQFSTEIIIENSINLGAVGEMRKGVGKRFKNFAFINYGVGVGAALVINGELYKGANNAAGEMGFMVLDQSKLREKFDEIGVLEEIIARDKIQNYIAKGEFQQEVHNLIDKYQKGDPYSQIILNEIFVNIGMALINISAFLDLEAIIISGGLGTSIGRVFVERWKELLKKHVPFPPQILFSQLNNQEGVLGAISVAIDELHKAPDKLFSN